MLWGTIKELPDTSLTTLALGSACLATLLLMRYRFPRLPRALIVVVLSIVAVQLLDLTAHGVAVTGPVPTGLFSVGLPGVGWENADSLLLGALAVIFVGYSESLASARAMATKHGYTIDPNQELIAEGAASAAAGLRRRIPDRRQPVEDLGCRRGRTADPDGVDPQRRARAPDDARSSPRCSRISRRRRSARSSSTR